jgi:hypothetical protein
MSLTKEELDRLVKQYYSDLNINRGHKRKISHRLGELFEKDPPTGLHSERVGILSVEVVKTIGRDAQIMYCPALGHDFGKLQIDSYLLRKKKFTREDYERTKPHVILGFEIMKKIDPFYAAVILWHHYHKPKDSYPTDVEIREHLEELKLPKSVELLSKEYGLLLAIADVYDSMVTRDNNVYGRKVPPDETKPLIFEAFKDRNMNHKETLETLYAEGIFGQDYDAFFQKIYDEHLGKDAKRR